MLNAVALVLSSLGVGGLLGVFAKSALDKRQLKFSKVFEYKEARYKVIVLLTLAAIDPSEHELRMLRRHRPDIDGIEGLDRELDSEYHAAMMYASSKVLKSLDVFLKEKNMTNWQSLARAMKKDLYI